MSTLLIIALFTWLAYKCPFTGVLLLSMFWALGVTIIATIFFFEPGPEIPRFTFLYFYGPTYLTFIVSTIIGLFGLKNHFKTKEQILGLGLGMAVSSIALQVLDKDK